MELAIPEQDAGKFTKINAIITEKAAIAGVTGRLSTWPVPVGYFFPEFATELAIQKIDGKMAGFELAGLESTAREVAGVDVHFNKMKENLDNYYLIIMDSIIY